MAHGSPHEATPQFKADLVGLSGSKRKSMQSRPFDNLPGVDLIDEVATSDSAEQYEIRIEGDGSVSDQPVVHRFDQAASVSEHLAPPAHTAHQHLQLEDLNANRKRVGLTNSSLNAGQMLHKQLEQSQLDPKETKQRAQM